MARYKWCPDKQCRPLGKVTLADGPPEKCGVCLGQLKYATHHIMPAVNDLSLCFKQGTLHQWHLNYNDLLHGLLMVCRALEARQQPLPGWLLRRLNGIKTPQDTANVAAPAPANATPPAKVTPSEL